MNYEVFSPGFRAQLATDLVPVSDIEQEARSGNPYKVAARALYGVYGRSEVREGLYNYKRDGFLPLVQGEIAEILAPWIQTGTTEFLPELTLKELKRATGKSAGDVYHALQSGSTHFKIGQETVAAEVSIPNFLSLVDENGKKVMVSTSKKNNDYLNARVSFTVRSEDVA